ncbi:ABC transporter permease [Clostridium sp. NSJ-49]|uniref:Oligopeptide ABC transporter permease n=1 Tax=Clostridium disporicum TaxID=84024 RepID=A0A173XDE7_9CLOT|nr:MULTISPECIES: ABC transporter permease [Clostridium]MBC5625532.1 ABC transporter permease [Clostridium sp. NSJ-49]MDU6339912.1 ABC transporter permease [Clostridium sp.]CUN49822.1 oligopeptide ABC transporter permease [Clostridium disporicum]
MIKVVLRKIFQCIIAIFILSLVVFYISRLSPGDPLKAYHGNAVERMSMEEKEKARDRLGLNEPIYIQYGKWLKNVAKGDFGISYKYKRDVTSVIKDVYKNTIILGGLAYILTFVGALIIGIFCAIHEDKLIDKIIMTIGNITSSIPSFWIALILILIFGVNLGILPTSGAYSIGNESDIADRMIHLILPLVVLVIGHLWYYGYMVRNKILEEMREDYVLLAKVKGLTKRQVVYRHCLRNIMPSFITIMAISVPHILAGTYVIEQVFSYPGIGTLIFESAKYHDYNMLMVLSLITGIIVLISNMIAQIINIKIDPRMNYQGGETFEPS